MKNILVTGSEGSIGQFIVRKIKPYFQNVKIVRVDKFFNNTNKNYSDNILYLGSLTDLEFCQKLFSENEITHIIHCAAQWNGFNQDVDVLYNNLLSINNLLFAMSSNVKKLVFFSTSGIYEDVDPMESSSIDYPQSSYGVSKLLGEKLVRQFSDNKNFFYTIYRPFHIVSSAENYKKGQSHVCTDMCYRIIECHENINIDELNHDRKIGFTWVEDLVDAIIENLDNDKTNNEIFNIGTSEKHSVKDLVNEILEHANNYKLNSTDLNPFMDSHVSNDTLDPRFRKIKDVCGWQAKTTFSDCIKNFISNKYL